MRVRIPAIDYSQVKPHWAPIPEFAQRHNASSTIPVYVEPFLIRLLGKARPMIRPEKKDLIEAVDVFNKQEGQHYQQHAKFNKVLHDAGYDGLRKFEDELRQTMTGFLANKSLKFCLAYAEAFESMGPPSAMVWFEENHPYLQGADPEAVALWKWHMAEEFEHRTVCFDLYHELFGRGPINAIANGWLYRAYMFIYAVRHLGGYINRVTDYLLEKDREGMTEEERRQSIARAKAVKRRVARKMLPRFLLVLSPFYTPAHKKAPEGLFDYLRRFEPGGDRAARI